MTIEEHGIILEFPDDNFFQFQNCDEYRRISGDGVKEMDVCWLESERNILWIIEMKAFHNPDNPRHIPTDLTDQNIIDKKLKELYSKSIHTLCLLETNRSGTQHCFTVPISDDTCFKLIHIISVAPGQEIFLAQMKDKLRDMLKPYLKIFRVNTCIVIPYSLYRGDPLFPWIR